MRGVLQGPAKDRPLRGHILFDLHIDYEQCRSKQYFKQGPAYEKWQLVLKPPSQHTDFSISKRLHNLPALLPQGGFRANRRIREVERLSQDSVANTGEVESARASKREARDLSVLALWHLFRLLPCGFANRNLRDQLAVLTGQPPSQTTTAR